MIIIDNIINNGKEFLLKGSVLAFLNILLIIVTVSITVYALKYGHDDDKICIDSTDVVTKIHKYVKSLTIYRATIFHKVNMMATHTMSHWFIIATLVDGDRITLSTSRSSALYVSDADESTRGLYKLHKLWEYPVSVPVTLDKIINFEHKLITKTNYDILYFNCQDIVYYTIKKFCKCDDLHKPMHGLKLCERVCKEIFD